MQINRLEIDEGGCIYCPRGTVNTLRVDGSRIDEYVEDGGTSRPYKTIQGGITGASAPAIILIEPGTYPENITLKLGVYLMSRMGLQPGVTIAGKVSWPSGPGTILMNGIYVLNDSDHAVDFGGTGIQKLRAYNCKFETNSIGAHHGINHTNTNVGSEIIIKDSLVQVRDTSGGAKAIETGITSQGSIGLDNTTVQIIDDIDSIAINLKGAIAYWHRMDEIRGRVIVSDLASCNIALDGMYANTLSCLETNSAGLSILTFSLLSSTASPIITGAGAFAFSQIGYASTGQGLAATLNGGLGAAVGAIPGESADGIIYDPAISGLTATRVKTALDEIASDYQKESEKNQVDGYPGLDGSGLINSAQLPSLAITDTYVVANEVAQLALTIQKGDVAVRSDENKSYINTTGNNVSMADWQELLTPTDAVLSVDARTGVVTLSDLYEPKDLTIMKEGENVGLLTNDSDFQSGAQVDADILTHKNIVDAHHTKGHDHDIASGSGAIATDLAAKFGDGGITNYSEIGTDGKFIMFGAARVVKSIMFNAYNTGAIAGTYNAIACAVSGLSALNGVYFRSYDDGQAVGTAEACNILLSLPDDYVDGTDIKIVFSWCTSGIADVVRWQAGLLAVSDGDTFSPGAYVWAIPQDITVPNAAWKKDVATFTIPGTGIVKGDDLNVIVFRDVDNAADTYTGDAYTCMIGIKYISDRIGE